MLARGMRESKNFFRRRADFFDVGRAHEVTGTFLTANADSLTGS